MIADEKFLHYLSDQLVKLESLMIDPEAYGMLRGQVESLRRDLEAQSKTLDAHMKSTEEALQKIQTLLSEAKGGWRVVMMIGGAAGSVGAFIAWAVSHIKFTP